MTTLVRSRAACTVVVLLALSLAGCSDSSGKKPKLRRVEGVAKVIDLENNHVSMMVKDDKGNEHELEGTVREDTEVWINGRSQKLEDVMPGDKVVVFGYRKGKGESKKLIATRVEVTRGADWKSTAKQAAKKPEITAVKPPEKPKAASPAKTDVAPVPQPAGQPGEADVPDEEARARTTDLIYARIRIEMEESIAKRAKLLKAGRPPSDPEIRTLEGVIMRARDLLLEVGEVVEPLDPPIVRPASKKEDQEKDQARKEQAEEDQPAGSGSGGGD